MNHNDYGASIGRVLMAGTPEERQKEEDKLYVRMAVMRAIQCPLTGRILDMRTAVLIDGDNSLIVMDPEAWDTAKEDNEKLKTAIAADNARVIDARELYA